MPPPQPSPNGGGSLPRVAIVGASVRAAAQSALAAGFEVVGADLFADADLDGVCPITRIEPYPEGLADWLAEQRVNAWMYTGALENYPELVDRMAKTAPLWGVNGESLRLCRDPLRYERVLSEAGVACPRTRPASRLASFSELGRPALAKTYRHAAGAGVWPLKDDESFALARRENAYAQDLLDPGTPLAAVFAAGLDGAALLGVTRQLFDESTRYAYRGSVGPLTLDERQAKELARLGEGLAGLRGLVGVDLVESNEKLFVVEINPRFTASIEVLERATGESAVAAHAAACRGDAVAPWTAAEDRAFAKRVLFAREEAVVNEAFTDWLAACGVADRPRAGQRVEAGQPVCTVFAEGADESEAFAALGEASRNVQERLSE